MTIPILIFGETGTGKTTLAKQIHNESERRNFPFVTANVAGISNQLFLSELFGHLKGSFTGAIRDKKGFCEEANNGTLFLDEIGEITLQQQQYLLRFIDEKKYYPVGSTSEKKFEGQLIFATNKNLEEMVEQGKFRKDLYYRLRIDVIRLKSLREDKDKIIKAVIHTLKTLNSKYNCNKSISSELIECFVEYDWPGNIRELKNLLEYLIVRTKKQNLTKSDLPLWFDCIEKVESKYQIYKEDCEKKYLIRSLIRYRGKINETSREIGLSKATLVHKIKKYTIDIEYIKILSQLQNVA